MKREYSAANLIKGVRKIGQTIINSQNPGVFVFNADKSKAFIKINGEYFKVESFNVEETYNEVETYGETGIFKFPSSRTFVVNYTDCPVNVIKKKINENAEAPSFSEFSRAFNKESVYA